MGEVNWALGLQQGPGPGEAFTQAFEKGMQRKRELQTDDALRALVANPNDPNAVKNIARHDPRMAIQVQERQRISGAQALEQYQGGIKTAAEVIQRVKAANPQMPDDQVYSIARTTLLQMRVPGAEKSPEQYDKQYFDGLLYLADPEKQNQGQIVPFTPGGGVARLNPQTGQVEIVVMPNDGSGSPGAPVQAPPVLTDQQIMELEQGGPTPQASAGFPETNYPGYYPG